MKWRNGMVEMRDTERKLLKNLSDIEDGKRIQEINATLMEYNEKSEAIDKVCMQLSTLEVLAFLEDIDKVGRKLITQLIDMNRLLHKTLTLTFEDAVERFGGLEEEEEGGEDAQLGLFTSEN